MIDTIQDLFVQKELYHKLLRKVESLEALLAAQSLTSEETQPSKEETQQEDDLTKIKGIGKVISGRLKEHGIYSFSQIASLTDEDITKLEKKLNIFAGKIKREDWVGQAGRMQD